MKNVIIPTISLRYFWEKSCLMDVLVLIPIGWDFGLDIKNESMKTHFGAKLNFLSNCTSYKMFYLALNMASKEKKDI